MDQQTYLRLSYIVFGLRLLQGNPAQQLGVPQHDLLAQAFAQRIAEVLHPTDCRLKLACCPRSSSERRLSASSASNSCARSTLGCRTCTRVSSGVHSRSTANQVSRRCSKGESLPICWRSTGRTPLKISSPSCRNRSRSPLKRSETACATIFKARGLPA